MFHQTGGDGERRAQGPRVPPQPCVRTVCLARGVDHPRGEGACRTQTSRGHTMARGEAVTSPQGQSGGVPRRPLAVFAKGLLAGRRT